MQLVSCHNGRLYTVNQAEANPAAAARSFTTGLAALDALSPGGVFARGAVHEILSDPDHGTPYFFALMLAKAAIQKESPARSVSTPHRGTGFQPVLEPRSKEGSEIPAFSSSTPLNTGWKPVPRFEDSAALSPEVLPKGAIVWCDSEHTLYPPAVADAGIALQRLFLLHPKTAADATWAVAECLRCPGVSATVAAPGRLSRVEARRFQLAAERGGGVGLLLRPAGAASAHYAAATRWLVAPYPGERTVQKWQVQLIHGHGGLIGKTILLERSRETNHLRAIEKLADRPAAKATG